MQPMLNIALRAARSAGELIFRSIERLDRHLGQREDAKDYVTEVDRAAEQTIIAALASRPIRLTRSWARKAASSKGSGEGADYLCVIDPLDGTTNFIHGVPHFAVSIACKYKGRLEHAVVLDPVHRKNSPPAAAAAPPSTVVACASAAPQSLEGALLGTGFPVPRQPDRQSRQLPEHVPQPGRPDRRRRAGAASLDLAYVAAGRYDAFTNSACPNGTWRQARPAGTGSRRPGERLHRQPRIPREGHIVASNTKSSRRTSGHHIQPHLPPSLKR
ncbi:inositol monophosphatase family protein [Pseudomonas aeruginosa]